MKKLSGMLTFLCHFIRFLKNMILVVRPSFYLPHMVVVDFPEPFRL